MIRPRRKRPEQQLQIGVMKFLDLCLPADAIAFHVPSGGYRTKAEAGIFKAMGVKAGCPDIIIFYSGRTLCIELKADKGSATPAQKVMHAKLHAQGIPVLIAKTLEAVELFLDGHGIPLRGNVQSSVVRAAARGLAA